MKIIRTILLLILPAFFLVACGEEGSYKDLKDHIAKLDQDAASKKKSVSMNVTPKIKVVTYNKQGSRSPFEESGSAAHASNPNANPLNLYPVSELRFVGVVSHDEQTWAYLMTPDNKIYEAKIGDMIGDHSGKIVKISPNGLEVIEQTSEDGKSSSQRLVTLQLKEEG